MISGLRILSLIISLLSLPFANAANDAACDKFLNQGWYINYKYQGPLWGKVFKEYGLFVGTTVRSVEVTTATFDPKNVSQHSSGLSQITSSWGPCNLLAIKEMHDQRELYFVQNKDGVMRDIASGAGEHLSVIAFYSLCNQDQQAHFASQLQKRMGDLLAKPISTRYNSIIDQTIEADERLRSACYAIQKS